MAQILTSVCDRHRADGELAEPVEKVGIQLDGETFLLDLCAEHYKAWYMPIKEELLAMANIADGDGQPIPVSDWLTARPTTEPVEPEAQLINIDHGCEFCDHGPFKMTVGMISHMRSGHPDEYPEWKARWDAQKAAQNGAIAEI